MLYCISSCTDNTCMQTHTHTLANMFLAWLTHTGGIKHWPWEIVLDGPTASQRGVRWPFRTISTSMLTYLKNAAFVFNSRKILSKRIRLITYPPHTPTCGCSNAGWDCYVHSILQSWSTSNTFLQKNSRKPLGWCKLLDYVPCKCLHQISNLATLVML